MEFKLNQTYMIKFHIVTRHSERDEWLPITPREELQLGIVKSFYQHSPEKVAIVKKK